MQLRHIGIFVQDISLIESILEQLGFENIYNCNEMVNYELCNIRKYLYSDGNILELIENKSRARSNSFHLCFDGNVPDFMLQYRVEKFEPRDKTLEVFFVYINDSIYFEFVKELDNGL
jgi:hypothetical protein